MKTIKQLLTGNNTLLILNIVIINILGIFTLIATQSDGTSVSNTIYKQILFAIISITIYYVISKLDYTYLKQPAILILIIIITYIAIAGVLIFGVTLQGARRWFILGSYSQYSVSGVLIQPSEFGKIALIIINSAILSLGISKSPLSKWKIFLIALLFTLSISILIFLEPDAGMTLISLTIGGLLIINGFEHPPLLLSAIPTVLIGSLLYIMIKYGSWNLFPIIAILIVISATSIFFTLKSNKFKKIELLIVQLVSIFLGVFVVIGALWLWNNKLESYQKDRITSFISEEKIFQIRQSQIAIGSGQFWGKGLGKGTQSKLHFLPEYQTDFIFASFAEQFGFLGSIVLLILYFLMLIQIFYTSTKIRDKFGSLICWGIAIKFALEILVNIGMNTGLTPATGVPLPFMSVGGSNLLANYLAIALVDAVYKTDKEVVM